MIQGIPVIIWACYGLSREAGMGALFTVGYEGTDIDRFVQTLKAAGVARLADVRAVAVSRKAGFSKRKLAARLADEGIEYTHFVALGDPKPGREAARAGNFDLFRSIYGAHIETAPAQESLRDLVNLAQGAPTCLLCFERDPETCHRTIVAREVVGETGFDIFNLFADDPERYVRHASKLPRFHSGQGATAA
ncbi:MAG: DUF488 family protein [Hyphomicrobiaceae bacterium]